MEIRSARPADAEAIRRVAAESSRAAYGAFLEDEALLEAIESDAFLEDLREWLADVSNDEGVSYLVAVEDDAVVGFVQLLARPEHTPDHVNPDEAFLKSLYVHPERWGEGIGSELLERSTGGLDETVERVTLGVLRGNGRAIEFYRSRGFERVGEGTYEIGGSAYPTLRFARER